MDKAAIQNFAIWARRDLIAEVSQRAFEYGITEDSYGDANAVSVNERVLSPDEQRQRAELVEQIRQKGYRQVIEEVAYTWFNRFIALRFMEVNNYLPSHIRVFSDNSGAFNPEILKNALYIELPGLNKEKVAEYIEQNRTEDLYRYLLLVQCNALNKALPRMFEYMGGYTELLLPNNILKPDGVPARMVQEIPEEDWTDQVQIIGWLYQYYISELKDETFALLKKNVKITKEHIPSATQLFTPDWIVRYMVENSLGRIFVDKRKNEGIFADGRGPEEMTWKETESNRIANEKYIAAQMGWKYYLPEAEQSQEVRSQLDAIQKEYANMKPQDIKVIDPCMGSGHILVYAFDVLIQIYKSCGVSERDAAQLILKKNLYGLDIDERAAQLAYFAVMMKARQYDRRIFSRNIQPHIYSIVESNGLDPYAVEYFTNNDPKLKKDFGTLVNELHDAKEYGSILNISPVEFDALYTRVTEVCNDVNLYRENVLRDIDPLIRVAEVMAQQYDVVVTNPPYMGSSRMGAKLSNYVKKNYSDSKSDLFAVFIERCGQMTKRNGYQAMITQHAWMFLSSYENLRIKMLRIDTVNMVHLGARAFEEIDGEVVQTTSFIMQKSHINGRNGVYCRLIKPTTQQGKEEMFLAGKNQYTVQQDNFSKIPGSPVAYWASNDFVCLFQNHKPLNSYGQPKQGLATGDNNRFLRFWFEPSYMRIGFGLSSREAARISGKKWFPCNKGGEYRKWFGNNDYVVNWENDGFEIRNFKDEKGKLRSRPQNMDFYFREGLTWSTISSASLAMRYSPTGNLFETKGSVCFFSDIRNMYYALGVLNSVIVNNILLILCPTLDFHEGPIGKIPLVINNDFQDDIIDLVRINIEIAKYDWDSLETSWNFKQHPLINDETKIGKAFEKWRIECESRFNALKTNEEELNRIFINIYGLQEELTPEVEDKDVTVHYIVDNKDDVPESMKGSNYIRTKRDEIVSLISYAVGCMFGRYSLDVSGIIYAGGNFNAKYCRWISMLGDKASNEIDENGNLKRGGWAGCTMWPYDGIRCEGKWIPSIFPPVTDNIIPISDDEYFEDDMTGRFIKWVETVYGEDTLEENLQFIADALGGKGSSREIIRNYFLKDFYKDHVKTYKKRPIYWLFDSGKKNGFKALIYMHRYQSDLLAKMRTEYIHVQQERYRTQLEHLNEAVNHASGRERTKLNRQIGRIQDQILEIQKFEEKIHYLADQYIQIDLDDGVKHNYALFEDVLAKL